MYHQTSQGQGHPVGAWPGHHPYTSHSQSTSQAQAAPPVHRPLPPPPIHYPTHAQQRQHQHQQHHQQQHQQQQHYQRQQQHHSMYHHQSFYHGHSRSPAGYAPPETRSLHHTAPRGHRSTAPVLVSPSANHPAHGSAAASPVPETPTSLPSPRDVAVEAVRSSSKHAPPLHPMASTPISVTPAAAPSLHPSAAAAAHNLITTKPPRPYTEYTMFYQLEREYILHRILTTEREQALACSPGGDDASAPPPPALFQNDPLMPARYCSLPLRADWYISGKSKKPTKRKHRKSHGKIGFLELTRLIAARWGRVDAETRKYCKMMAAMELVKYKEDMEGYNAYKEQLGAVGEIPEDMKERLLKKQRVQERKDARTVNKLKRERQAAGSAADGKERDPPAITADAVSSLSGAAYAIRQASGPRAVRLEPLAHDSPHEAGNLDNDMEEFITSLVDDQAGAPARSKKRRLSRERPAPPPLVRAGARPPVVAGAPAGPGGAATAAGVVAMGSFQVPLKHDAAEQLDGIDMTFSGIDEGELARELSDAGRTLPTGTARAGAGGMRTDPSFDYWDAMVETSTPV